MTVQQQLQMLNKLYKESDHVYSNLATRLGMTNSTFWILYAISHSEEPLTQNDLCNEYFFPVQTVNSTVTKLLKEDVIRLEFIPGTRNRKKIVLTDKGKEYIDKTINKADEIEKNAFLMFNEDERELYISLFKRHIDYLNCAEKRMLDTFSEQKA